MFAFNFRSGATLGKELTISLAISTKKIAEYTRRNNQLRKYTYTWLCMLGMSIQLPRLYGTGAGKVIPHVPLRYLYGSENTPSSQLAQMYSLIAFDHQWYWFKLVGNILETLKIHLKLSKSRNPWNVFQMIAWGSLLLQNANPSHHFALLQIHS